MMTQVRSLGLHGVEGYEVLCECDLSGGLPNFEIVGLPDTAVKEARDRVRSAVKNCGFDFPVSRNQIIIKLDCISSFNIHAFLSPPYSFNAVSDAISASNSSCVLN